MKRKTAAAADLAIYAALMIYLMFLRPGLDQGRSLNLVPFASIKIFIRNIFHAVPYYRRHAVVNLLGNIVMFIPLGLLPPVIWKKQRRFPVSFLTSALVIVLCEAVQYITARGAADIDDLILNLIGAVAGFIIYRTAAGNEKE